MFEGFTERAINAVMLAQEEARRLGHNFAGTEHILLGLIKEGTGVATRVLKSMGINLKDARVEVIRMVGESTEAVGAGVGGGSSGNKMPTPEAAVNLVWEMVAHISPTLAQVGEIRAVVLRPPATTPLPSSSSFLS
ncbi:hypothetical protein CDL15_Pgr017085 [Punica granatum]|nr:hypothetical protein CDL15_Pgr017085 [Punica granatum]